MVLTLLVNGYFAQAQQLDKIEPIKIGEKVPDVVMEKITNYDGDTIKLSDFRGKWLILDFWATWCSPCVAMISKMDSLQQMMDDQVQFLSITYEKEETVIPFLEKLYQKQQSAIPIVYEDTILKQLFPNNVFPHYVWIDPQGIVRAITESKEITEENVEKAIVGGDLNLRIKKDDKMLAYDKTKQPFLNFILQNDNPGLTYYSFFMGYTPGLGGGMCTNSFERDNAGITRITFINSGPHWFFRYAFGRGRKFFQDESIDIDVKEPGRILSRSTGLDAKAWIEENTFCYELVIPEEKANDAWEIFRADVEKYFSQYDMRVERRKKQVLALIRTSDVDKIKTKGGRPAVKRDRFGYEATAIHVDDFIVGLSWQTLIGHPLQVIDRTGYKGRIDLKLESKLNDIDEMNKELSKYDLQFKEMEGEAEVLVIRDRIAMQ